MTTTTNIITGQDGKQYRATTKHIQRSENISFAHTTWECIDQARDMDRTRLTDPNWRYDRKKPQGQSVKAQKQRAAQQRERLSQARQAGTFPKNRIREAQAWVSSFRKCTDHRALAAAYMAMHIDARTAIRQTQGWDMASYASFMADTKACTQVAAEKS